MNEQPAANRDYSTISPSARAVLLLKGYTDVPFARRVAELVSLPEVYLPDFNRKDFSFWLRVLHFEYRYRSINRLLSGLGIKNILELSSGFSFRGLTAIQEDNVHYIDTDLPDIIHTKQSFVHELQDKNATPQGTLEILPLNALDEQGFQEVVSHFPAGKLVIVNEGLLMYLDTEEKRKLCGIIRNVLKARGGYWITADIYLRQRQRDIGISMDDKLQQFFNEHRVEEKMFESFEEAEAFFKSEGFVIDKEVEPEYQLCGSLKYLLASATEEQLGNLGKHGKIHTTWRLKLAEQ